MYEVRNNWRHDSPYLVYCDGKTCLRRSSAQMPEITTWGGWGIEVENTTTKWHGRSPLRKAFNLLLLFSKALQLVLEAQLDLIEIFYKRNSCRYSCLNSWCMLVIKEVEVVSAKSFTAKHLHENKCREHCLTCKSVQCIIVWKNMTKTHCLMWLFYKAPLLYKYLTATHTVLVEICSHLLQVIILFLNSRFGFHQSKRTL